MDSFVWDSSENSFWGIIKKFVLLIFSVNPENSLNDNMEDFPKDTPERFPEGTNAKFSEETPGGFLENNL